MVRAGHVARVKESRNVCEMLIGNPEGKNSPCKPLAWTGE
jgi:hypothetical protein